ncbi:transcriptional repressor, partial [Acetomicrobium flavidum]
MDEEKLKEKVEEYLRSLQEKGFRITSQRRLIVETILQNWDKHPNVRELLDLIQEKDPSIGLATIYRTVELLVEMGFLHEVNLDEGFSRFEVSRKDI